MKTYRGSGGIAPPFMTSALDAAECPGLRPENCHRHRLDRRLVWPQSRSEYCGKETNLKPSLLYRLSYPGSVTLNSTYTHTHNARFQMVILCFILREIKLLINQLTPRSRLIFVRLIVAQLVKISAALPETQGLIMKCFKSYRSVFWTTRIRIISLRFRADSGLSEVDGK
jgi:hypothetical protein